MLRKIYITLLTMVVGVGLFLPQNTSAVSSLLIDGQHHYYTVQMRSDKQAIVYAKLIFEAPSDKERDSITVSLPSGVSAENLSALQILAKPSKKTCVEYQPYDTWLENRNSSSNGLVYNYSQTYLDTLYDKEKNCLAYSDSEYDEEFDFYADMNGTTSYYNPYYYSSRDNDSGYEYKDAELKQDGQKLSIALPNPIKAGNQGSVLISFTSRDFISGFLGRYTYAFRTLITDQSIEDTVVAINFDDDLYSREASQTRTSDVSGGMTTLEANDVSTGAAVASDSIDRVQRSIGSGGRYVQEQGKMLPGDTLEVKGVFATSPLLLMVKELLIILGVLAALIALGIWYRHWRKKHPKAEKEPTESTNSTETPHQWHYTPLEGVSEMSFVGMIKLSAISTAGTAALMAILAIGAGALSSAALSNGSSAIFVIYLMTIPVIAVFGLIIIPTLTVLQYGVRQAKKWAIIQLVCVASAALLFWVVLMMTLSVAEYL